MSKDNADLIALPLWWRSRDTLVAGAVWTRYNHEMQPGIKRWLERWMMREIQSYQSPARVIELGNSLRYFAPELFEAVRDDIYRQTELLFAEGKRVSYSARMLEILLPALVDMNVYGFVIN